MLLLECVWIQHGFLLLFVALLNHNHAVDAGPVRCSTSADCRLGFFCHRAVSACFSCTSICQPARVLSLVRCNREHNCRLHLPAGSTRLVFYFVKLHPTWLLASILVTDRVSREVNAIGSIRPSVRPTDRLSVCSHSVLWTDWPLNLSFCVFVCHDHSSPGIESQDHKSRSEVNAAGLTSILDRRQFF